MTKGVGRKKWTQLIGKKNGFGRISNRIGREDLKTKPLILIFRKESFCLLSWYTKIPKIPKFPLFTKIENSQNFRFPDFRVFQDFFKKPGILRFSHKKIITKKIPCEKWVSQISFSCRLLRSCGIFGRFRKFYPTNGQISIFLAHVQIFRFSNFSFSKIFSRNLEFCDFRILI